MDALAKEVYKTMLASDLREDERKPERKDRVFKERNVLK
jgi:hypothetical protein